MRLGKTAFWYYKFVILLLILQSSHAWFLWHIDIKIISIVVFIFSLFFVFFNKPKLSYNWKNALGLLLIFVCSFHIHDKSITGLIGTFFPFFPFLVFVGLNDKYLNVLFLFIKKSIAYILIPSIILHVFLLFIEIPSFGTIYHGAASPYVFENYFVLVKNNLIYSKRFCGIFLEPGYLGTLCFFLLFADRFDLNTKENKVLFVALLASFSLAAYLLSFLGYLLLKLQNKDLTVFIKSVLLFLCFTLMTYLVFLNYNNGNNIINQEIFARLKPDEEKLIQGNNRLFGVTEEYYFKLINSDKIWNGMGIKEIEKVNESAEYYSQKIGGAGYMLYILINGMLITLLIGLAYFLLALNGKQLSYSLTFLFLCILCFIQASYPLSASWLVPYVIGLNRCHSSTKAKYSRKLKQIRNKIMFNGKINIVNSGKLTI